MTDKPERKPHLSHSQIACWMKCPLQYYWRYERGVRIPPSSSMTLGSAFDRAANHNYQEKIDLGKDAPLDVLTDVLREDLKAREEETIWEEEKPRDVEKKGLLAVKGFREKLAPPTNPLEVQRKYTIEFENRPYRFIGFADLIAVDDAEHKIIVDHKVGGQALSARVNPQSLFNNHQLTAYAACEFIESRVVPHLAIDALVILKTKDSIERHYTERVEADLNRWWRTVDAVWRAIEVTRQANAWHPPVGENNWVCSPKWCGYWHVCHENY